MTDTKSTQPAQADRAAANSILRKRVAAERGVVAVPVLAPQIEWRRISSEQVLLVSESVNTVIRSPLYAALVPLLDGRHPADDLVTTLSQAHSAREVRQAIAALSRRGYVVSGEHGLDRASAAFWSSLGASPRWAEERLGTLRVAVAGDGGERQQRLAARLGAMGVGVGGDDPALVVAVCTDYLEERHAAVNERHIASGTPWMLVAPTGMQPLFGPVFRAADGGPCWRCLVYRLRGHQEVHNFLRNTGGEKAAFKSPAAPPGVVDTIWGLVAIEVAKWLVLEDDAPIHNHAVSVDMTRLRCEHHHVMRRPQCFACGDAALYRADRPARPMRLRPSPKVVRNSGGLRSVAPEETLARYRHLISPVSGVVSWVSRTTDEADPWLHVYWAGSNFALTADTLGTLRGSLRAKSAGKGSTQAQSEASGLCEAVERYCCAFHGEEICRSASHADFEQAGESAAIHPNAVQLFSERQLDNAGEINARGHPLNFVPARFDPDAKVSWSPVWSFTERRHRWLPTSILYVTPAEQRLPNEAKSDSNGCAAGNTLEEAILQGFYELVERDAFAIWWYNRLRLPGVDLESFDDDYLNAAPDYYARLNRELWVLDATSDFGVPVFVAVSRRTDGKAEDIIYGAGAHADPHVAALRAVCELNQFLDWTQGPGSGAGGKVVDDPMCLWWWNHAKLADHDYLAPLGGAARRTRFDYPPSDTTDVKEDVERCQALVEARGMEFLALDLTRPDIGMPVARVMVPGMRHFWERFAPGRLYDVPVKMGWREHPTAEADLNPAPVTI